MKNRYIPPATYFDGQVSMAFVDNILILLTTVESWRSEDNVFLMNQILEVGGVIEKPSLLCQYFGEPFGGKASHRKQLADWQSERNIAPTQRIASLTDSLIMRGAMTAYSWLIKTEVKPFKPEDLDGACRWLVEGETTSEEKVKEAFEACYSLLDKDSLKRCG